MWSLSWVDGFLKGAYPLLPLHDVLIRHGNPPEGQRAHQRLARPPMGWGRQLAKTEEQQPQRWEQVGFQGLQRPLGNPQEKKNSPGKKKKRNSEMCRTSLSFSSQRPGLSEGVQCAAQRFDAVNP